MGVATTTRYWMMTKVFSKTSIFAIIEMAQRLRKRMRCAVGVRTLRALMPQIVCGRHYVMRAVLEGAAS
jgi:hypothetical protein